MSRTYRDHRGCSGYGAYHIGFDPDDERNFGRDRKPNSKRPSSCKRTIRRLRRAQDKQAIREGREPYPRTHAYDWWW